MEKRNNKEKKHVFVRPENRLIGIVRFYDPKGFGFIDTNGFGIDLPDSGVKSRRVELFFNYNDLEWGAIIHSGDWVTFSYEKAPNKKRDRARCVRRLKYTEDEYLLALNYHDEYSTLSWAAYNIREEFAVIPILTRVYSENKDRRQFIFNSLIDAYSQMSIKISKVLYDCYKFAPEESCCFFDPSACGILINDAHTYKEIIKGIIALRVREYLLGKLDKRQQARDSLLDLLIKHFDTSDASDIGRDIIEEAHKLEMKDDDAPDFLPLSLLETAFPAYKNGYYSPNLRLKLYSITKNASYLIDNSVIDHWNNALSTEETDTIRRWCTSIYVNDYDRVGSFIADSTASGDALLFLAFLTMSKPSCYDRIKDRSICSALLPKMDCAYIRKYLSSAKLIPRQEFIESAKAIGLSRIADIVGPYDSDITKGFPNELILNIIAVLQKLSEETKREQSGWYGGYFTWGEGMKHQRYNECTYIIRKYRTAYYVENSNSTRLNEENLRAQITVFREQLKKCQEASKNRILFVISIDGEDFLVVLYLQDTVDNSFYKIYEDFRPEIAKILIHTEVFIDD